jgi:outer membrane lipoprotein carrier protein
MKYLFFLILFIPSITFAQQPAKAPRTKKKIERKQARQATKAATPTSNNPATDGNDKSADRILDNVSKKYKSHKSFQARFTYTIENKADNIKESQTGTITTSGHKFRIEMAGQEIYCDGKTMYTFNKETNEVSISDYSPKDAEVNPSEIFTMYQKGFLSRFVEEKSEGGRLVQTIELSPKDKKKTFFKVRVTVDKAAMQILRSVIFDKNGNIYTYSVNKQTPNVAVDDKYFIFDKSKHPGVQVIDLR